MPAYEIPPFYGGIFIAEVPETVLTEEDEDILNYDDLDDPDAFV